MTPSEQCKAAGLKGLAELVKISGASVQTLINWSKDKPMLFAAVVAGAVVIKSANMKKELVMEGVLCFSYGGSVILDSGLWAASAGIQDEIKRIFPGSDKFTVTITVVEI